ncbi:MAG: AEC family transporter [Oscillospiraceae bacterium]
MVKGMLLFQQMIILLILMLVGYICYKVRMLTDDTCKMLSSIVLNIANPALILYASMGTETKIQGTELAITVGIAFGMFGVLMLVSYVMPIVLKVERKSYGIYRVMTTFSNIGFMGFPLISAVYGTGALLYASLFSIPYNILIYTYGINAMKKADTAKEKLNLSKVFNIGVIACILSVAIYLLRITLPQYIISADKYLSDLTAPLSMIVIGASLATINIKKLFIDGRLLAFAALKLVVIPIAGFLLVEQIISDEVLRGVCFIMLATPVGSMTAMLAQQYDGDYEVATKGVALTTLLSVATIPLVSAIMM